MIMVIAGKIGDEYTEDINVDVTVHIDNIHVSICVAGKRLTVLRKELLHITNNKLEARLLTFNPDGIESNNTYGCYATAEDDYFIMEPNDKLYDMESFLVPLDVFKRTISFVN